jgi:DNA-binding MarR family transcriptional regulator
MPPKDKESSNEPSADVPTNKFGSELAEAFPLDNLSRLLTNLTDSFDQRLYEFVQGTKYQKVRPSDGQVVVSVARGHVKISEIAKVRGVSRQAIHMAALRLQALGLIELKLVPNNMRDKHIVFTAEGRRLLKRGAKELADAEAEMAQAIGAANFVKLRKQLVQMDEYLISRRAGRKA